jgi:ribosomal protein L7/L12
VLDFLGGSSDFTAEDAARLRRVERKLDLILAHLGISHVEGDGEQLPEEARVLADRGETIAAIKVVREESGLGLAEAKRAVDSYLARHRGRTP